jgi:hypothetical protein
LPGARAGTRVGSASRDASAARVTTDAARARADGVRWQRLWRGSALGLTVGILAVAVQMAQAILASGTEIGCDFVSLRNGAETFWRTGSPYTAVELAGPFEATPDTFIYPPTALFVVAPFAFLPAILWWAIPLGAIGWFLRIVRPALWSWPLLALGLFWPRTINAIVVGGSDMWITAGIALALGGAPLAPLLPLFKPTVAPLALVGIRRRGWWIVAAIGCAAAALMAPLWLQYLAVVRNYGVNFLHSLPSLPMYAIPLIAWFGRRPPRPPVS